MLSWTKLRGYLAELTRSLALILGGAVAVCKYIEWNDLAFASSWGMLDETLIIPFWLFLIASSFLRPEEQRSVSPLRMSPDYSGGAVILLTGVSAATAIWWLQDEQQSILLPVAIALASLGGAVIAWRFAAINRQRIGEARFPIEAAPLDGS